MLGGEVLLPRFPSRLLFLSPRYSLTNSSRTTGHECDNVVSSSFSAALSALVSLVSRGYKPFNGPTMSVMGGGAGLVMEKIVQGK